MDSSARRVDLFGRAVVVAHLLLGSGASVPVRQWFPALVLGPVDAGPRRNVRAVPGVEGSGSVTNFPLTSLQLFGGRCKKLSREWLSQSLVADWNFNSDSQFGVGSVVFLELLIEM